jgi:hypothetical protein
VIVAAAVVPHPPVLLPGVTGAPVPEVEELRRAASETLAAVLRTTDSAVVVGAADVTKSWPDLEPMRSGFLGDRETGERLPLSLSVVRALLPAGARVEWRSVAVDAAPHDAAALGRDIAAGPEPAAVVIAGDGSARRGPKAPGYEDVRAHPFDAAVTAALAAADTRALAELDPVLAADLMVSGRAPWQVLAAACRDGLWSAELGYAGDPFGVHYVVARWSRR